MTDAELDARLERLSDEDLQQLSKYGWNPNRKDYLDAWLQSNEWIKRMASEILDLRRQLLRIDPEPERCRNVRDDDIGLSRCELTRSHDGKCCFARRS